MNNLLVKMIISKKWYINIEEKYNFYMKKDLNLFLNLF